MLLLFSLEDRTYKTLNILDMSIARQYFFFGMSQWQTDVNGFSELHTVVENKKKWEIAANQPNEIFAYVYKTSI